MFGIFERHVYKTEYEFFDHLKFTLPSKQSQRELRVSNAFLKAADPLLPAATKWY